MTTRRFKAEIIQDDETSGCGIALPFNPKDVWGKIRVPVVAKIKKHSYRTTVFSMKGCFFIPLNKQNREAAGVAPGDTVMVTLEPDTKPRTVTPPPDLQAVLKQNKTAATAWNSLSYSHQREHVRAIEEAKRPETRARRLEKTIAMLSADARKPTKTTKAGDVQHAGAGDAACRKRTGKSWSQWFAILDKAGGQDMTHKQIAAYVHDRHGVDPWWSQQVTVGYEQARKGRQKHEKPGGFEIGSSKTINVPIATLFSAWSDKRRRKQWLDESDFTIRKTTRDKSMRITWVDGETHVDANFWEKGAQKSMVQLNHRKLAGAKHAEAAKAAWKERLAALKSYLEKS